MFTFKIDGKPMRDLSNDELGALLQHVAVELSIRGNDVHRFTKPAQTTMLWAFNKVEEVALQLRRLHE